MQKTDDFVSSFRKAAPYLSSVYTFMASIGLFGYAGYWLDKKYESKPLYLLIGLFVGLIIGFYQFYRVLAAEEKRDQK